MCVSMGIMVFAYWKTAGDTDNILTMARYQNRIVEEYKVPDHVDPGAEIDKVVNVKNTGSVDTIVRLSVEKMFGDRKADGTFEKDEELDPEMVEISYNTTSWTQKADGYFYYKDILKAGKTTKEPLFTSYKLSMKAGNAYKGKEARIIVRMESVQAEGNAVSIWGVTYKDLGITEPKAPESTPTRVTYLGKEKGFDITSKKTDLFAGYKNLLPGCSRTQKIYIENDSEETVEIFLRADTAEQNRMSKKQLKLVEQMLKQYAAIEITYGKETIYKGPVYGNPDKKSAAMKNDTMKNNSIKNDSMKNDISLGTFKANKEKTLTVKLSMDPAMDNEFMSLTGKVKWIFTAEGKDNTDSDKGSSKGNHVQDDGNKTIITAVYPEKTGLEKIFECCAAIFAVSLLAGIVVLAWPYLRKKKVRT